jgi:VIT1/CCC1 family predicted Fe2+/Mn2+ transporter/rubrerythrin
VKSAPRPDPASVPRYRENLQGEVDGVAVYRAMADSSKDAQLKALYTELAETEERHAKFWSELLATAGAPLELKPSWRARTMVWLAKRFGPGMVAPRMAESERRNRAIYDNQPEAAGTEMASDERSHARVLATVTRSGMEGSLLARFEGRHKAVGGNALRAAVLGANDGLVSNFSLVMGIAGASSSTQAIVVAGLAGALAGALSMALGEWLSVQSARELFAKQISIEEVELELFPEEEEQELRLIYEAKGIPPDEAQKLAASLMKDPKAALNTLAREELGVDPEELGGSAWVAAGTSFVLFSIGAIIPVLPFIVGGGIPAAAIVSAIGLFIIGAGITLVTGRPVLISGLRQVAFGLAAAAISYGVGRLVGVAIA